MKKSQHRKVVKVRKVKKRLNPKSGSVPKKPRPPELRTSANQDRFSPPKLERPLPN